MILRDPSRRLLSGTELIASVLWQILNQREMACSRQTYENENVATIKTLESELSFTQNEKIDGVNANELRSSIDPEIR